MRLNKNTSEILSVNSIINNLFFLLGITSTITLLRIPTPIKPITAHNFILYLLVVTILILNGRYIKIKKSLFLLFSCIVFLSFIVETIKPIGSDWKSEALKNAINYVLFYNVLFLYIQNEKIKHKIKFTYINGLKISILLQLFWESLQIIWWYCWHIKINVILFSNIKLLNDISFSATDLYGNYRFTGLSWQPSNLGISLLLGVILFKNIYLKIACIIGIIASTSRVGIVTLVLILIYKLISSISSYKINIKNIINEKGVFLCLLIILGVIYLFAIDSTILSGIYDSVLNMKKRFGNLSWDLHTLYYIWAPEILFKIPIMNFMFGYGLGCSGYVYSHYKGIYTSNGPWIPENDFCSTLFGCGITGLITYYAWYMTSMKQRNRKSKDYIILLTIFIAGFMYAYMNSWVLIVAMFCMTGKYIDLYEIK